MIDKKRIETEAEHFFEWPTDDRTHVTRTSMLIFAGVIAEIVRKESADRIEQLEREKEFSQVIADGDKGIMNLLAQKPVLAGFKAGSTTLGNLRASLFEHRPQGVMGDTNAQ